MKTHLLILLFACTNIVFGQTNLIQNGSFENNLTGWTNVTENGAKATFSLDTRNKQIGRYTLKAKTIILGPNAWDIVSYQKFNSRKDKNYRLTFSAKSTVGGNTIKMQLQNKTYQSKDFTLEPKWKEYNYEFQAKENDLQLAIHYLKRGTYYIDNISIVETGVKSKKSPKAKKGKRSISSSGSSSGNGGAKSSSALANGGFENGFEGWNNYFTENGKAEFKFNEQTPHSGKRSMRVMVMQFGANPWSIQSLKQISVKRNKKYRVTFYAKAASRNKKIKVQVQDNPKKIYLPFEFNGDLSWQKHEFEFIAPSETMELALQHISSGMVEYDDFRIQQIKK